MFRATGPGKIEIDSSYSGVGVLKALLYNFDFDDFADMKYRELKPEHKKFLTEHVAPLLAHDHGLAWMQGSASRIGTPGWNKILSQNRVVTVAGFLTSQGVDADQMQLDAVGEELAEKANHAQDDERDRSVTVLVQPKVQVHDTPPPRKVPPKPKVSRQFKIAMLGDVSVAKLLDLTKKLVNGSKLAKRLSKVKGGVAGDVGIYMVWDTTNNLACTYVYIGLGIGAGITSTPSVSATLHGPWNTFTTEKPIGCWQFGRWARFTTASVIKWSVNWLTLETPRGVDNVNFRIDTGTTLGAGASTTVGDFIRVTKPESFSGP